MKKKIVLRNQNAQFTRYHRYAFCLPRKHLEKRINERTNKRVNTLDSSTLRLLCWFIIFFTYLLFLFFSSVFRFCCLFHAHLHRANDTRAFCIQKRNRVGAYDSRRNAYDEDENKIKRRPGDPDWFSFRVFNRRTPTARMLTTSVAAGTSGTARHRRTPLTMHIIVVTVIINVSRNEICLSNGNYFN